MRSGIRFFAFFVQFLTFVCCVLRYVKLGMDANFSLGLRPPRGRKGLCGYKFSGEFKILVYKF